jgi:transcriptional regulator with XRE-family HTH domain
MSVADLGPFIRSRREAISPVEVGLPDGPRRRTPGLRRSELAMLAGISVEYLVRLEQGRDTRPSAQVVTALANALRLGADDRAHLRQLVLCGQGGDLGADHLPPATEVRPSVRAILDRLEPSPALVLNGLADVLAWTSGYQPIGEAIGILDGRPPNLLRYTFTDPRARAAYPEWSRVADEQVANLRPLLRPGIPGDDVLLTELSEHGGHEFTRRWASQQVQAKRTGIKRLVHPVVGELRLVFETLTLPDADHQRLVVYLPADDTTADALDRLSGRRPGQLHAVDPDRQATG